MRTKLIVGAVLVAGAALTAIHFLRPAKAADYTVKSVMEAMNNSQRNAYIAGVIEGLAYARYANDNKKTDGMECIYAWYYKDPEANDLIYVAFGKYPDYTPGAVISVLADRKCGK